MANTQCDMVEAALGATETTETNLGTITIPANGISRIVALIGLATAVPTSGESLSGYFRLAFKSIAGVFKFPLTICAAPLTSASGVATQGQIIPVTISVPANETVTVYAALNVAQTGSCRGQVSLMME